MKRKFLIGLIIMSLILSLGLAACGEGDTPELTEKPSEALEENITLRVVCTQHQEPIVRKAESYFNENGYDLDVRIVEMNVMVPESVQDGSADMGLGVHLKFMERYNEEKGGEVIMAQPYAYAGGIGLFSDKYENVDDLPEGAQIVVMTDAMNQDRGLRMMQHAGLLSLDSGSDNEEEVLYSLIDIVENPKNFEIVEMDQTQTVRSLIDTDAAVCFFSHIVNAGIDIDSALLRDQEPQKYPSGFVLAGDERGGKLEKVAAEVLMIDEVKSFIKEDYKGAYVYFDDLEDAE